jgi:hypothetical protein
MSRFVADFSRIHIPNVDVVAAFKGLAEVVQAPPIHAAYIAEGIEGARRAFAQMQSSTQHLLANITHAAEATLEQVEQAGPTKIASANIPALDVNLRG